MNLKKFVIILFSIVLACNLFACSSPVDIDDKDSDTTSAQDFPVTVNGLTISSQPEAVAVLSANVADMILALGYEDSLVLATQDCTQSDFESLAKVSSDNYQAFVDAGVDLVVTDEIDTVAQAFFDENNIPVFVVESAVSRSDFERMYSELGAVLRGATTGYENGIAQAKSIYTTLDDISRVIPNNNTITTAVVLLDLENSAVTGDMVADDVIASAGATNAFTGSTDGYYDLEQLTIADPDYIFCLEGLAEEILTSSTYSSLKAVQNGTVYELTESNILWNGRSLITGATAMAGMMYPSLLGVEVVDESEENEEEEVSELDEVLDETEKTEETVEETEGVLEEAEETLEETEEDSETLDEETEETEETEEEATDDEAEAEISEETEE